MANMPKQMPTPKGIPCVIEIEPSSFSPKDTRTDKETILQTDEFPEPDPIATTEAIDKLNKLRHPKNTRGRNRSGSAERYAGYNVELFNDVFMGAGD